jgi:hypothetical protein
MGGWKQKKREDPHPSPSLLFLSLSCFYLSCLSVSVSRVCAPTLPLTNKPFNYGPIELQDFLRLQPLSYILSNIDQPGNSFYLFTMRFYSRFYFYHLFCLTNIYWYSTFSTSVYKLRQFILYDAISCNTSTQHIVKKK